MIVRKFRDRDFIETREGMFFCVIGNVHPRNRIISYLKYVPWEVKGAKRLGWRRNGREYGRILPHYSALGVQKVKDFLKHFFPNYVYFDKYLNIEIIGIPVNEIKTHYRPEVRMQEILKKSSDELEADVAFLARELASAGNISKAYLGVTGSILIKIHNPKFSDIDLIVYGRENALRIKNSISNLINQNKSFRRLDEITKKRLAKEISQIHPLTLHEAYKLISERWYNGFFRGRFFSIHPVKLEREVNEIHEQKIYRFKGIVTIKCKVEDASESMFLPSKYLVKEVRFLDGREVNNLREVVSYEGLYCDAAANGDIIYVRGKLEEVNDLTTSETYHRVQVGSFEARGSDFIKNVRWIKG